MRKVREAIIVEGRYDKNTVSQAVDAVIIETGGFGIFSDKEKGKLLRRLAEKRGVIVFTDSDGAGFLIRNRIKGMISEGLVKHAYIPDIYGKEKRKSSPSKEGKLGVEGMDKSVIIDALTRAGATFEDETSPQTKGADITKADFYDLGLSGKDGSNERRRNAAIKLGLPERISANAMLDVVNALYSKEEFINLIG